MDSAVCVWETDACVIHAAAFMTARLGLSRKGSRCPSDLIGFGHDPLEKFGSEHLGGFCADARGFRVKGGHRVGSRVLLVDVNAGRGWEGDGAVAAEEGAEEPARFAVGDAFVSLGDEAAEDSECVVGDIGGR